jgi:hypothetical protein
MHFALKNIRRDSSSAIPFDTSNVHNAIPLFIQPVVEPVYMPQIYTPTSSDTTYHESDGYFIVNGWEPQSTPEQKFRSHGYHIFVTDNFANMDNIYDIGLLIDLYTKLEAIDYGNIHICNPFLPSPFNDYYRLVLERVNVLYPTWNNAVIQFSESEQVNGYKLCDNFRLNYMEYRELLPSWLSTKEYNWDEFLEKIRKVACADWYKMDEHGESFGGFWKYPENSYERSNASILQFEHNCKCLFELPYSHDFIFETIKFGCGNRRESVRYTNILGVFMDRKREAIMLLDKKFC